MSIIFVLLMPSFITYVVIRDSSCSRVLKFISVLLLSVLTVLVVLVYTGKIALAYEYKLDSEQRNVADRIAAVANAEWETYGVLPSVAVAQAYCESQLGKARYNGWNMWGIGGVGSSFYYESVEDGTYGYLRTINNGYYGSAPFTTNAYSQISKILYGGYCPGSEETYISNVMWTINTYGLSKYDEELRNRLIKEKIDEVKTKTFKCVYDKKVKTTEIEIDNRLIKKGSVCLYFKGCLDGIYDVKKNSRQKGRVIRINNKDLDGKRVKLMFYPNAKG